MTDIMSVLEEHFKFPFPPHPFQLVGVGEISKLNCSLLRYSVGLGKTYSSVLASLYASINEDVEQILILCPPILLDQWYAFLQRIEGVPEVLIYRGTPAVRKKIDIENASIILASYNIFRGTRDFPRFKKISLNSKLCIIADELSLKSLGSGYKKYKDLLYRKQRIKIGDPCFHKFIALNATPISCYEHVYNWCSLFDPGRYLSYRRFCNVHVEKEDHWGKPLEWWGIDILEENMNRFTVNTTEKIDLPSLVETVVPYTLSKAHQNLYNEVKEMELDNLPEDKVQTALNSAFSTLQRVVLIPREYGLDIESPVLEFILGYLDQMGPDDGVLIYTRHVAVSKLLAEKVPDCVAIYGGVSKSVREEAFEALKAGECKRLVGNMDSLGVGLELQMLNHVIWVEQPFKSDKLTQGTGRVHRQGQKKTCFANFPLAKNTLQERIYSRLLQNGEDMNKVLRTKEQVREFLG